MLGVASYLVFTIWYFLVYTVGQHPGIQTKHAQMKKHYEEKSF